MVPQALQALVSAEVIVGYKTYLDLISDLLEGKTVFAQRHAERAGALSDGH